MTRAVASFVAVALALVVAAGVAAGFDSYAVVVLALILAVGLLAVAVARKSGTGEVRPARCRECGGLLSPEAPYCKHCGARLR